MLTSEISVFDPAEVIYLGTFSKTFAPGPRVGWAAAPPAITAKLTLAAESAVRRLYREGPDRLRDGNQSARRGDREGKG
jgi:aspartate/methionine/tyrosine aminotransferase